MALDLVLAQPASRSIQTSGVVTIGLQFGTLMAPQHVRLRDLQADMLYHPPAIHDRRVSYSSGLKSAGIFCATPVSGMAKIATGNATRQPCLRANAPAYVMHPPWVPLHKAADQIEHRGRVPSQCSPSPIHRACIGFAGYPSGVSLRQQGTHAEARATRRVASRVRASGRQGVRASGRQGVRASGRQGVKASRRQGVKASRMAPSGSFAKAIHAGCTQTAGGAGAAVDGPFMRSGVASPFLFFLLFANSFLKKYENFPFGTGGFDPISRSSARR